MKFSKVYPLYIQKSERENRTRKEADQIICLLTGFDQAGLQKQINDETDFQTFFEQAPLHAQSSLSRQTHRRIRQR